MTVQCAVQHARKATDNENPARIAPGGLVVDTAFRHPSILWSDGKTSHFRGPVASPKRTFCPISSTGRVKFALGSSRAACVSAWSGDADGLRSVSASGFCMGHNWPRSRTRPWGETRPMKKPDRESSGGLVAHAELKPRIIEIKVAITPTVTSAMINTKKPPLPDATLRAGRTLS